MNIVRKMMGPGVKGDTASQDHTLGLMHLRKLFAEFRHPPPGTSQTQLEDKLYNMLPLFCKVFGNAPTSDMSEKFADILQFCSHTSRLMVSEIRLRASNQSTDAASFAIVKFLEIESTEESSNGWMLLSALNLLSNGSQGLIDCMTAASLPSTLVKCLYLFFDLPDVDFATDKPEPGCQFSPIESRVLLQKVFVQLLVRLCSHVSPAEELARRDDLTLLFSAITSWCPPHNVPWRKSAAEVLMTLSRHGLTTNVVQYIHGKGCVGLCIENMQRVQELSPIELVEMFVTVFCFLKDSSEVSQILLDDFRSSQGYGYLSEFLLRMEKNQSEDAVQALRNLVLLMGSLTNCGFIELKPSTASSGSLFQMPGFTVPQPAGQGMSVRNVQAFQVLQTVFLKATSIQLLSTILDVISSIYHQDNANYFILEPQNTLSQFAEKIHTKPPEIQEKFYEIVEFIVFNLNYVPCKELISLSILIKTNMSVQCSIMCMRTLLRVLKYHDVYKDVFREVGLLEVIVTCLHRYAALLKEPQNGQELEELPEEEQEMGLLTMESLALLLSGNNSNAGVFRECGGARCSHNMVPYLVCRAQALSIVQQLVLSNGGDDDMGTLLGLMHTAPTTSLELKTHILKSLLNVLRESHRTRTVFRKVGGFVYVMSVLVSMEGCLAHPPTAPWDKANRKDVILLLRTVFSTLTVAMRYEPANARVFATEVRYASLTEAVRLLGCFGSDTHVYSVAKNLQPDAETEFKDFFCNVYKEQYNFKKDVPQNLISACMMLRYLYDMALDNFDKPLTSENESSSPNIKRISSVLESTSQPTDALPIGSTQKRASTGSLALALTPTQPEPLIVHAGAVISMLHLVPGINGNSHQLSLDLQMHTCEIIKSVVRTERNQQVMCEAGLPHELLTFCNVTLANETHPLHPLLQYVFERLAAQSLTPKDLRDFLRLGEPLCCAAEDEEYYDAKRQQDAASAGPTYAIPEKPINLPDKKPSNDINRKLNTNGGAVPLTRVKCLVSMTTPRDVRLHGTTITPAFVEFDMAAEGFGCLYLPSIAPQGPPTPSVVGSGMIGGSDPGVVGGIGTGERLFPPQSGLTFSTWLCIDKFSVMSDPHSVRLLSVVRTIQGREDVLMCLNVFLAARDRALFVSTRETHMPLPGSSDVEADLLLNDTMVRFWCPELTQEGQWRHVTLIFHKAGIMKNSSVSLFVDGIHVNTQKLHYISPNLGGGGTASPNAATSVFCYIGTPPQLRRQSRLLWRQGPCHLLEDIISSNTVQLIYQLGPNYVGSFQAPITDGRDSSGPLLSEEKIMFGVHAHAMSLMTVAKIRKIYTKVDAKCIAKQLGMSAHENATPIRILHNSAGHLSGPARSFGAILMGYLGVRTFCPKPVAKMILNVGGTSALLGLIAMATDVEGLYAAVKALVCVVKSNKAAQRETDRTKGYQTLALLFKKKRHLLNSHILHLTFSLVGTVDSGRESTIIPNTAAFEDLLCDLDVWHEAPGDLQKSLYEHFYELLTESSEQKANLKLMQEIGLVTKLLYILKDPTLSNSTLQIIANVISVLLSGISHPPSLLKFGQFMVSLLPETGSEKCVSLDGSRNPSFRSSVDAESVDYSVIIYTIKLRNICLDIIRKLLQTAPTQHGINLHVCEELLRILGFDWLLLFLQSRLHQSTVVSTMRLLLLVLGHPLMLQKFREGATGGGWLHETESVLENRIGVVLGFGVSAGNNHKSPHRGISLEVCHLAGFQALQLLLPKHTEVAQIYFLLMGLLLGQPVKELPHKNQFDLDTIWTLFFGVPPSQPVKISQKNHKPELCPDASVCILAMIRAMLNQPWENESDGSWLREYPVTLMQFLLFLYHNQPAFLPLCMTGDFVCALAATLFPYRHTSESDSEHNSPTDDFKPPPGSESSGKVKEKSPSGSSLTMHPARKFVMDFLRMIVVDSLSLPQTSKSPPVIDLVLEASPEHSSKAQRREFQTEILKSLMDHLLAADALLGDQAALPIAAEGSYTHMANNVFHFAARVVDKLSQGYYLRDSKEVFEFISQLIAQAKRKALGLSLDGIYKCLNRTILYQLSRPVVSVADQTSILDTLHKLTSNRSLVFGPGNYDQEFFGCLCYCLLQLTDDPSTIRENPALRRTTWHVEPDSNSDSEGEVLTKQSASNNPEGLHLLATAARRVWEELYVCKKPAIEEIFKVSLTTSDSASPKFTKPDLNTVRPTIIDSASRLWVTYFENEKKCASSQREKIQSQLHSKLQKVGHGVLRLATRKPKRETPAKSHPTSVQDVEAWTAVHVSIVKDLVEFRYKQYLQSKEHMEKYLLEDWTQVESELMRERGLWGPPVGSEMDKYTLDMTEGPHRMRKKMILNDTFYINYPYRTEKELDPIHTEFAIYEINDGGGRAKRSHKRVQLKRAAIVQDSGRLNTKYKVAVSRDSNKYFERYRCRSLVGDETVLGFEAGDSTISAQLQVPGHSDKEIPENDSVFADQNQDMSLSPPSLLPRLPKQSSSRVTTDVEEEPDMDSSITGDGSQEGESQAASNTDNRAVLRLLEEGEKISHMFRCARIQGLDTIEGLLLFGKEHFYIVDGFTLLRTKEIEDIDTLPAEMHDPIIPKTTMGCGVKKRECLRFAYEDIREVHKRRYLLQPIALEIFSADGRNQLLAFPRKVRNKVYARYLAMATEITDSAQESISGQKLNAKVEPGTGLISSLIGEKSVTQRWERGEISNFEYLMCLNTLAGRSYNDLMQYPVFPWVVADYDSEELDLYNPETFRDLSKPMGAQTPNRLKQYKKRYSDWDDPQGDTPPYHYGTHYSSAMIVASYLVRMEPFTQIFLRLQGGHFDLADRMFHSVKDSWLSASKHNMADVKELIPEFFYLPELLLNSNNFDLGTKQSGVALGDIILPSWAKHDPKEFIRAHREALECDYVSAHLHEWIDLIFGFKQRGPSALEAVNVFHHLFYEGNVDIYSIDDPLEQNATIGFINNFGQIAKQLFKKPHPQKKLNLRLLDPMPMGVIASTGERLFFHNLDNLKPTLQPVKELKCAVGQIISSERSVLAVEQNKVLLPPTYNKYLAWGFSDLSIRIGNYDSDKASAVFENLDNGEILCATCPSAKVVITAGTSTLVNVWEFGKGRDKKSLTLKQALCAHTEPVTCVAASSGFNIIVSGSRDRTCIMWDMCRLCFVRQLRGHAAPVAAVCINELTGDIATCAGTYLHVWGINGDEIASINTATGRSQQILCVAMSQMMEWNTRNVIMTGNSDGVVRMWSLEFVEVADESKLKSKQDNSQSVNSKDVTPPGGGNKTNTTSKPQPINISGIGKSSTRKLRDFKDAEYLRGEELGSSAESYYNPLDVISQQLERVNIGMYENEADLSFGHSGTEEPPCLRDLSSQTCDGQSAGDLISFEDGIESSRDDVTSTAENVGIVRDGFGNITATADVDAAMDAFEVLEVSDNTKPPEVSRLEGHTEHVQTSDNGGKPEKIPVSPTSLGFEVVSAAEVKQTVLNLRSSRKCRKLRDGFKWQRQLVFRSKLTMHTAFERKDNKDPASVTALAVSKDHKTIYVGDAKGRVYSWSVTDQPGRAIADHWVKDEGSDTCKACDVRFSLSERRHHCRNCGQLFCSKCSRFETEIRRLRIVKPVRVCQSCFNSLRSQHGGGGGAGGEALAKSANNRAASKTS